MVGRLALATEDQELDAKAIVKFFLHIHSNSGDEQESDDADKIPNLVLPRSCGSGDPSACLHCARCQYHLVYSSMDQRQTRNAVNQAKRADDDRTIRLVPQSMAAVDKDEAIDCRIAARMREEMVVRIRPRFDR